MLGHARSAEARLSKRCDKLRWSSDLKDDWLSFVKEIEFLRSSDSPPEQMISIYRTRNSYVEDLFEGIVLEPRRQVARELRDSGFSFVPNDTRRRLIKHRGHFLAGRLRRLAQLTYQGDWYTDSAGNVAATQKKITDSLELESEIKLRSDILTAYCGQYGFVAFWVIDSYRFSERLPKEYDFPIGRSDLGGPSFCYFYQFGACDQYGRSRMHSFSLLCGKRLLFPPIVGRHATRI